MKPKCYIATIGMIQMNDKDNNNNKKIQDEIINEHGAIAIAIPLSPSLACRFSSRPRYQQEQDPQLPS